MINFNPILRTDSYKLGHYAQYQEDTEQVYSYLESRQGALFDSAVFFGLQPLLEVLEGRFIRERDIEEASDYAHAHFGTRGVFNYAGWSHILNHHHGHLPLEIKAVPEGTPIPVGNVMMTVENTCKECFWVTNALESYLSKVWYPITVSSLSRKLKQVLLSYLERTSDNASAVLQFMLHDFGYRSASSEEAAALGGAAHLVNFSGTDTLLGMQLAHEVYGASLATLAFSVPATEHSVMTALGSTGEKQIVEQLLHKYEQGILSIVGDSYNIYNFVEMLGSDEIKEKVLARDGKVVVRPDSNTKEHPNPADQIVWIISKLWEMYEGQTNSKGYRVLDSHVGTLWGDGLDAFAIEDILQAVAEAGFSVENLVLGMGGGLLQKQIDRDVLRFAFKCSAQKRGGRWYEISKEPLDATKKSKVGRLKLVENDGELQTVKYTPGEISQPDLLQKVFIDGILYNSQSWNDIRQRATIVIPKKQRSAIPA